MLSKKHKECRLKLISLKITLGKKLSSVTKSDLVWMAQMTGGLMLQKTKKQSTTKQCRGGSIMTWLMSFPNGLLSHKLIAGKFNSDLYIDMMKISALPIMKLNFRNDIWLQEDNA